MREGARVGDRTIHQCSCIAQVSGVQVAFLRQHVEADFGCRQVLSQTVVEFASDPAAFFILNTKQFYGETPQGCGALLYLRFERAMCSAERFFRGGSFAQMIANLVLSMPCDQCAPDRADQMSPAATAARATSRFPMGRANARQIQLWRCSSHYRSVRGSGKSDHGA